MSMSGVDSSRFQGSPEDVVGTAVFLASPPPTVAMLMPSYLRSASLLDRRMSDRADGQGLRCSRLLGE